MGWRRIWRKAVAVTSLALLAGGCGASQAGSAADQRAVRQTVRTYLVAIADGNGARVCGLTTAAGKSYLASIVAAKAGRTFSCEQTISLVSSVLPPSVKAGLRTAVVNKVTITGTSATIRDQDITSSTRTLRGFLTGGSATKLTKASGQWMVTH